MGRPPGKRKPGFKKQPAGQDLFANERRFHTKVTPAIRKIAGVFPGNDPPAVQRIANFVFERTRLHETVWDDRKRYKRTATEVMQQQAVDLLHCYDRSHALIAILAAKRIPAQIVISLEYTGLAHSFVETHTGGRVYTIAFRTWEPPIFAEGRCETAIQHGPGTSFVRGRELGDFGVRDKASFNRFIEQMLAGKAKGRILFGWGSDKR
jgi:hypothetical protein